MFENFGYRKRRKLLLLEANFSCSICKFNVCREDGSSILEIDHIDGNHKNNVKENLRVLCPNCHALTPNFRNWGRSDKKTSTRFRKGNLGYEEAREKVRKEELAYKENFSKLILDAYEQKTIDFNKFGWVQKVSLLTNESHKMVCCKMQKFMPDFYYTNCFRRSLPKRLKDD